MSHGEGPFEGDIGLHGTNRGLPLFRRKNSRKVNGDVLALRHIYNIVDRKLPALGELVFVKSKAPVKDFCKGAF